MNKYGWADAALAVQEYVVKIETPDSYGSGFLINYRGSRKRKQQLVFATAFHVIEHAEKWSEVIRISKGDVEIPFFPNEREIMTLQSRDLALVVINQLEQFKFPERLLDTVNPKEILPPGFPVGWCGYPNIADQQNCFFAGHLSSPVDASGDYLVDGVVIHGVSGAPAFINIEDHITLIGVISAYLPNRAAGEALPGMSLIRSVNPFTEYFSRANGKAKKPGGKREAKKGENAIAK